MSVKSLRINKNWSQDQLAHLSGLNVRTIQRIEKGERVGLETLKSLAAVFEISVDDLKCLIDKEKDLPESAISPAQDDTQLNEAHNKVASIKRFYIIAMVVIVTSLFIYLPNYNEGENLEALIYIFSMLAIGLIAYACAVFKPFGKAWETKKAQDILEKHKDSDTQ